MKRRVKCLLFDSGSIKGSLCVSPFLCIVHKVYGSGKEKGNSIQLSDSILCVPFNNRHYNITSRKASGYRFRFDFGTLVFYSHSKKQIT